MFSTFRRRLPVAVTLVLFFAIGLVNIQPVAFGASTATSVSEIQSHNPKCQSAFGERVCITASPAGLTFKWSGYTYFSVRRGGGLMYCRKGCGVEDLFIQGENTFVYIDQEVIWKFSSSHSVLVRLKKPDDYEGAATLGPPWGGKGVEVRYRFIVPQVGNSNLVITTKSLPTAKLGVRYQFRLTARGGEPPYSWDSIYSMPKGLTFIRTGPRAGTITGTLRQIGNGRKPFIVHDKVGHAAISDLVLIQVP